MRGRDWAANSWVDGEAPETSAEAGNIWVKTETTSARSAKKKKFFRIFSVPTRHAQR